MDRYPFIVEHMGEHITGSTREGEEGEFEFGLDLVLDGLEKVRT
jgi:tetracycline repressor-like protein